MKKFIAVLLCIAMLASTVSVLGAAVNVKEKEKTITPIISTGEAFQTEADYPIVFVTGIGQSYSYFYETEEQAKEYYTLLEKVQNGTAGKNADGSDVRETDGAKTRWNLFCNDFSFAFKEFSTYPALLGVVFGLLASFSGINLIPKSAVKKVVSTLFRYNIIDEDGKLPGNVITPRCNYPVSQYTDEQKENFYRAIPCQEIVSNIGEDMLYCYNYSAFSFTFDNAAGLDDFITNYVLPQSGKNKCVLVPMSMGASVVSAYLYKYQNADTITDSKVARVVSIVGAWDGSDVFADLIELSYAQDAPEKLYNGILSELIGEPWGYLVNLIIRFFPKSTLRSIIDRILDGVVTELVLKTPSLLALIPADRYEKIRKARFEGNENLAYIMKQTDDYYNCQVTLKDRLKKLNSQKGVDFYYLAGYGLGFGEYSSDYKFFGFLNTADSTNSDEIIQISSTATGATYAAKGTQLATYNPAYTTPDKSVDVSTCFFPDRVWLFKGQKHELENNNTALRLALDLACGKIKDVNDINCKYPQFNESRDLKKLNRNYLPDLYKYVATKAVDKYFSAEQKAEVKYTDEFYKATALTYMDSILPTSALNAYNDVVAMKERRVNSRQADDKLIEKLVDEMTNLGIYAAQSDDSAGDNNDTLKKINDWVYKVFGAKGYIDIFHK